MTPNPPLLPAEPGSSPQSSAVERIFVGKDGLRAGWSLLTIAFLTAIIFVAARIIVLKFFPNAPSAMPTGEQPSSIVVLRDSIPLLAILVATWIMSKIERRPVSVYGLGGKNKFAHLCAGFASGVICLSLLVLALWKTGLLAFDRRLLFGSAILLHGTSWLLAFLLIGLLEEYFTRGYIQYTLTRGLAGLYQSAFKTHHSQALGFWTSALIWSAVFGLSHTENPGESPVGLFSVGLIALIFCLSLWRTGSLWWAIGFHAAWDWSQSFLYGVADSGVMIQHHLLATHPAGNPILSGGTTGPEGSIFILIILALTTLIIFLTLPDARSGSL